jgi:hypothetical protein
MLFFLEKGLCMELFSRKHPAAAIWQDSQSQVLTPFNSVAHGSHSLPRLHDFDISSDTNTNNNQTEL